jgi:hypothetical protein
MVPRMENCCSPSLYVRDSEHARKLYNHDNSNVNNHNHASYIDLCLRIVLEKRLRHMKAHIYVQRYQIVQTND